MSKNLISLKIKKKCVEMAFSGLSSTEIYREYFSKVHDGMSQESFRRELKRWKKKTYADTYTMNSGTYPGFSAHDATVQVDNNGEIVQAWIKQSVDDNRWNDLLCVIKDSVKEISITRKETKSFDRMLEIPLFDMHFPLTSYDDVQNELFKIIEQFHREEINIIIGQDLFHNDDFRGRTSSGRDIEKIDISKAWKMARNFWYPIISVSLENSNKVNIIYSKGNHDESLAWAFVKELESVFTQVNFDTSLEQRKCINWKNCFIGVTHGSYKKTSVNDLRGQFTIQYPKEFAESSVREIHAGHLHHEMGGDDIYGVIIRRLSTKSKTDEWLNNEGYIGAHKRFMVFEYSPGNLKTIHYL